MLHLSSDGNFVHSSDGRPRILVCPQTGYWAGPFLAHILNIGQNWPTQKVFATTSTFRDLQVKNFPASIKSLFFLSILNATWFSSYSDNDNFFQWVANSSIKTNKVGQWTNTNWHDLKQKQIYKRLTDTTWNNQISKQTNLPENPPSFSKRRETIYYKRSQIALTWEPWYSCHWLSIFE